MKSLILILSLFSLSAFAITGLEVMQKVKAHNEGFGGTTSEMKMELIDAHGNTVERVMSAVLKEDAKNGDKSITSFEKPLDIKGTKLLTWTMKDGPNKQWIFLPKFKRVKKINASNQAGSFMGSEFSYEDIGGQEISKYNYKLISENADQWVVESISKEKSGYSKMVTVISKTIFNPLKVEYFDRRGELLKRSILEDYKLFTVNSKKINMANKITMVNIQTKKKSIITWNKRNLGVKLNENDFKSSKLK